MKNLVVFKTIFNISLLVAFFSVFMGCSETVCDCALPESNDDVRVNTSGKSVDSLLSDAVASLKREQWDEAIAYYNAAYDKDNSDERAVIYSVLANLAKISTDPKVITLIKGNFGFTDYPGRLNSLFSNSWLKSYPYSEFDSISLPGIKTPDWLSSGDASTIYKEAMFSGNVFSADNWALSILANLLDKNTAGLNNLLDDVIDGVFGLSYNTAVDRLKKLESKKESRISLDPYFIEQFGFEGVFDEYDQIGWAEVNVVMSVLLLTKASLEWVQSYDLNTNLNWLKYSWKADANDWLTHFNNANASDLPFNNNFLKVRSGKMAKAKADYIKAIEGFQASYTSIINSDLYPAKVKKSYTTINEGFSKLVTAINSGSKFYIPENPTEGSWPTTKSNDVVATIDFGKFFTEGYFSLDKIFEVESNGKPVFYYLEDSYTYSNSYLKLTKENYSDYESVIDGGLRLKLNLSYIKAVSGESEANEVGYLNTGLHRDVAKAVFEKYYN